MAEWRRLFSWICFIISLISTLPSFGECGFVGLQNIYTGQPAQSSNGVPRQHSYYEIRPQHLIPPNFFAGQHLQSVQLPQNTVRPPSVGNTNNIVSVPSGNPLQYQAVPVGSIQLGSSLVPLSHPINLVRYVLVKSPVAAPASSNVVNISKLTAPNARETIQSIIQDLESADKSESNQSGDEDNDAEEVSTDGSDETSNEESSSSENQAEAPPAKKTPTPAKSTSSNVVEGKKSSRKKSTVAPVTTTTTTPTPKDDEENDEESEESVEATDDNETTTTPAPTTTTTTTSTTTTSTTTPKPPRTRSQSRKSSKNRESARIQQGSRRKSSGRSSSRKQSEKIQENNSTTQSSEQGQGGYQTQVIQNSPAQISPATGGYQQQIENSPVQISPATGGYQQQIENSPQGVQPQRQQSGYDLGSGNAVQSLANGNNNVPSQLYGVPPPPPSSQQQVNNNGQAQYGPPQYNGNGNAQPQGYTNNFPSNQQQGNGQGNGQLNVQYGPASQYSFAPGAPLGQVGGQGNGYSQQQQQQQQQQSPQFSFVQVNSEDPTNQQRLRNALNLVAQFAASQVANRLASPNTNIGETQFSVSPSKVFIPSPEAAAEIFRGPSPSGNEHQPPSNLYRGPTQQQQQQQSGYNNNPGQSEVLPVQAASEITRASVSVAFPDKNSGNGVPRSQQAIFQTIGNILRSSY